MPADVEGTLAGLAALKARIEEASALIAKQSGLVVQAAGMKRTHVRTGTLRRSWHTEGPEGGGGAFSVRVGPSTVYARRQELGFLPPLRDSLGRQFPHDPGWPYVRPAFEESVGPVERLAVRLLREAIGG